MHLNRFLLIDGVRRGVRERKNKREGSGRREREERFAIKSHIQLEIVIFKLKWLIIRTY